MLHPQILPGGVVRPGVGIAARGGQALVAQGLLHEVGRGAAVERVGGMGVPKPMWRDAIGGAGVSRFAGRSVRIDSEDSSVMVAGVVGRSFSGRGSVS